MILIIAIIFLLNGCTLRDNAEEAINQHKATEKLKAYYVDDSGYEHTICDDVKSYVTNASGKVEIACESDNSVKTYVYTPIVFKQSNE